MDKTELYRDILGLVRRLQRNVSPEQGIYPFQISAHLEYYRADGTLRRDMMEMAEIGLLERIGGEGARKGYRVARRGVDEVPRWYRPRLMKQRYQAMMALIEQTRRAGSVASSTQRVYPGGDQVTEN